MDMNRNTEREEFEVKGYVQRYWKLALLAVLAVFIVIGGVQFIRMRSNNNVSQASDLYQALLAASNAKNMEAAHSYGVRLVEQYADTPYGCLASLMLAKDSVDSGDLAKAEHYLRWAIEHKKSNPGVYDIAVLRLVTILQQQGDFAGAFELLQKPEDDEFAGLYSVARGDLYVAQGQQSQAQQEYKLALEQLGNTDKAPLVKMKLLDVGYVQNGEEQAGESDAG